MSVRLAVAAALVGTVWLTGCEATEAPVGDRPTQATPVFDGHTSTEDEPTTDCAKYPVPFDSGAREELAREALASLNPEARLDWSAPRGTPARIDYLDAPLACAPGQDVFDAAVELFASRPTLFHIAADEWVPTTWLPCEVVGERPVFLVLLRDTIAGMASGRDLLTFIVSRVDGELSLRTVVGVYLGAPQPHTATTMRSCHSMADVEATARDQTYEFETFFLCQRTGLVSYTPQPGDITTPADAPVWRWVTNNGVVSMRAVRRVDIEVAPDNVTDELLASTAACPQPDGSLRVGLSVDVDDVTGELLSAQPGLGCIVCAQ